MLRTTMFCLILLLFASRVPAQRSPLPTEAGLMEITERGRLLVEYDAAAWHSTDAVLALQPEKDKLGRYVARKIEGRWKVVYGRLNQAQDKFLITYEADAAETPEKFTVKKHDRPQEDAAFYLSAARAIDAALAVFSGKKRSYNAAVLPANSDQLYVYVYPAQTQAGVYPIGGDVRYLITADGSTIQETRKLHNTVLDSASPRLLYRQTPRSRGVLRLPGGPRLLTTSHASQEQARAPRASPCESSTRCRFLVGTPCHAYGARRVCPSGISCLYCAAHVCVFKTLRPHFGVSSLA